MTWLPQWTQPKNPYYDYKWAVRRSTPFYPDVWLDQHVESIEPSQLVHITGDVISDRPQISDSLADVLLKLAGVYHHTTVLLPCPAASVIGRLRKFVKVTRWIYDDDYDRYLYWWNSATANELSYETIWNMDTDEWTEAFDHDTKPRAIVATPPLDRASADMIALWPYVYGLYDEELPVAHSYCAFVLAYNELYGDDATGAYLRKWLTKRHARVYVPDQSALVDPDVPLAIVY